MCVQSATRNSSRAADARVVGATIIGPSSPTSSPDGNSRSRPPTPRPNSSTKRRPRWRVTAPRGSSANVTREWRDWHRERAAEWDRVRQIRRSEIAAFTHRFNARLRARRAQFRAWRLETKTGALTRAAVAKGGAGHRRRRRSGRRREDDALFTGVSRLAPILFRVGEGTARRGGARSSSSRAACDARVCDRYRREPFRGWRRLTWTNRGGSSRRGLYGNCSQKLERHATRMFDGRRREGARGTLRRWREAVEKERKRSLIRARAEAMHTRRAVIGRARMLRRMARRDGSRRRVGAKSRPRRRTRRTRRRTRAVFNAWRADAVSVVRAFATLRSLARVERARRGFLDASDSFRGWRRVTSEAASSRFSAASTARAARRFAKDSASRRLRRVVRMWYAIAGAAVAHPERRRAHDVAVAAHRRSNEPQDHGSSVRRAPRRRRETSRYGRYGRRDAREMRRGGWMARATREARGVLGAGSSGGARRAVSRCVAAVARDRLVASGKTFLRRWREIAMDATEARRTTMCSRRCEHGANDVTRGVVSPRGGARFTRVER